MTPDREHLELHVDDDAAEVWATLEATPGFSARIRAGQQQLDRGEGVPFVDDDRIPRYEPRPKRSGCSVLGWLVVAVVVVGWWL